MAYIKYARTASGGVSVQVVRYKVGRIEVLKHFGTAHNDLSLDHLIDQAEDFLGTNAQLTLDIGVEPPEPDHLIVTSMDRLACSLVDLHTIVEDLVSRGVSVRFLREGQTYFTKADPIAKLMLGLMGSVAEFERSIIRGRQAEGIARAKARGVYKGRAKVLTDAQVTQTRGWVAGGAPKAEVARSLEIGRTTLYKYLREPD